jgi:hypothetical protein
MVVNRSAVRAPVPAAPLPPSSRNPHTSGNLTCVSTPDQTTAVLTWFSSSGTSDTARLRPGTPGSQTEPMKYLLPKQQAALTNSQR